MVYIIVTTLLMSCASITIIPDEFVYKYVVESDVKEFAKIVGVPESELRKIKYRLAPALPNNAVAVCSFDKNTKDNREIVIAIQYIMWYSDIERRSVVFHELAHCYCGRPHISSKGSYWKMIGISNEKNRGNCPISLMNPTVIDKKCLQENWEEYIAELASFCPADLSYLRK